MKRKYDLHATKYICQRCNTPIEVESDCFHSFTGPQDPWFWCPTCEDFPRADLVGIPAESLPTSFSLLKGFVLRSVPLAEPSDADKWNLLYRPYSKRSFLRQYIDWLKVEGVETRCELSSTLTVNARFHPRTQQYTADLEYEINDSCEGQQCQFLQQSALRPKRIQCPIVRMLCDVRGPHGLCQTGDEAMILQQYLILTGGVHFPMLIPQASILKGKRRADFLCFVPLTKFQYRKIAVLVDRPGKKPSELRLENTDYESEDFVVRRILIDRKNSYFKIARELVNWIEAL